MIQSLPRRDLAEFLQKFASETCGTLCESSSSTKEEDQESQICSIERWLREAVKPEKAGCISLEMEICFCTDGDFFFTNVENIFNPKHHAYEGAVINYDYDVSFEYFEFRLRAEGDECICSSAARDLLGSLICHASDSGGCFIYDVCEMLHPAVEQCLWNDKAVSEYEGFMHGNYEGTHINMKVARSGSGKN